MNFSSRPTNSKKNKTPWQHLGALLRTRRKQEQEDATKSKLSNVPPLPVPEDELGSKRARGSWFHPWLWLSGLLFVSLAGGLLYLCTLMWLPRDLSDVHGLAQDRSVRDISRVIQTLKPGTAGLSFSESELNAFLAKSCRMRQHGSLATIAHPSHLALKIHDGYAELVITRDLGSQLKHTISVFLKFSLAQTSGSKRVLLNLDGGTALMGMMQAGGRIGHLPVPEGYMQMLLPTLKPLLALYPALTDLVEQYDYLPVFEKAERGREGRLRLVAPLLSPPHHETDSDLASWHHSLPQP